MLGVFAKLHSDSYSGMQIFGRVGLAMVDIDLDMSVETVGSVSESYDDTGLAFGVGAAFNISDSSAIVAEYSILPDVDFEGLDIETDTIAVGFQMSF
jgi:opacity protein-like surface antigen